MEEERLVRIVTLIVIAFAVTLLSGQVHARQVAPKAVVTVVADGVRYKVPQLAFVNGKLQVCGVVRAWDIRNKKLLWDRIVYCIRYNESEEQDVQNACITQMSVKGTKLLIKNERSEDFEMDIVSGSVRALTALGPEMELSVPSVTP
jgi:hypothetical protein